MENNNILKLTKYGLAGVAIAALALAGFVVNKAFDLMGNHLKESTKTQEQLKGSVDNLDTTINRLINTLKISYD